MGRGSHYTTRDQPGTRACEDEKLATSKFQKKEGESEHMYGCGDFDGYRGEIEYYLHHSCRRCHHGTWTLWKAYYHIR